METCNHTNVFPPNETHCESTWDTILCWPATKADTFAKMPCPEMKGSDSTRLVTKYCDKNGDWEGYKNYTDWTNYTGCYTGEMITLIEQINNVSVEEFRMKIEIAKIVRILEIVGLTSSFIILCICFGIYSYFRCLRNERTRIHIHLFFAVICTVIVKLIIYVDQIIGGYENIAATNTNLDSTQTLCIIIYVTLEYFKSSIYMWMFIEALHLHHAIAITATKMSFKRYYLILGWGVSAVLVIVWGAMMVSQPRSHCWWAYNYNSLYWILQVPRILILVINTIYLVNIVRVIFNKLRRNASNETEKIRKTTQATLVLLPLLGITDFITYLEPKLDDSMWYFMTYSFVSYFLNSFQGMIIGLLYCLLNQEVKEAVLSKISASFTSGSNSQQQMPTNANHNQDNNMYSVENAVLP